MKIRAHESFYLRRGWLQKGIKNILKDNRIFNDRKSNACDVLGVGTNMVRSMKYWMLATGVAEEVYITGGKKIMQLTPLGELINAYDKYFEEIGTNLIIHYQLVTNENEATAWYWLFNIYDESVINKQRFGEEFNNYIEYVLGKPKSLVLDDEYNCIIKTYIATEREEDPEETKICPLAEIGLLSFIGDKTKDIRKTSPAPNNIAPLIALAFILDYADGKDELPIQDLCDNPKSIGRVLNLSRTAVIEVLNELSNMKLLKIDRTAGLDIVKILQKMTYLEALEMYYKVLNGENI